MPNSRSDTQGLVPGAKADLAPQMSDRPDTRSIRSADTEAPDAAKQFNMLEQTMLKNRTLTIFGEINKDVAQRTAERLLALAFENDDPITLFVGSPGGHVESGDTIFDMIRFIKPQVLLLVLVGWAVLPIICFLRRRSKIVTACRTRAFLSISRLVALVVTLLTSKFMRAKY